MQLDLQAVVILTPIVVGLTQLVKMTKTEDRFVPLSALALGVIGAIIYFGYSLAPVVLMTGIVAGLSAAGLYDQKKITG